MGYALKQFTEASIEATQGAWRNFMDENNMFDLEYMRAANGARGQMDYSKTSDNEYAYGIFLDDSEVADAIVSILHQRRGGPDVGWLKMLQLDLSPTFDESLVATDLAKFRQVIRIYLAAIGGTVTLQSVHRAKVTKLYGRTSHLLSVFTSVANELQQELSGLAAVAMEGRWLVIRSAR
ncbi:hypothetical protein DX980_18360 [Burkholderia gladioli]|uniref:hypothetical protein n=1 Tax=Burkholderia gladioli TaxID=28095 RepID=UPI001364DD9B|nr:hypothetical protein [Burkholderia gladioli]WAG21033.1 hypothetical protein DX980_18360 [Burkholderia gladioli]